MELNIYNNLLFLHNNTSCTSFHGALVVFVAAERFPFEMDIIQMRKLGISLSNLLKVTD